MGREHGTWAHPCADVEDPLVRADAEQRDHLTVHRRRPHPSGTPQVAGYRAPTPVVVMPVTMRVVVTFAHLWIVLRGQGTVNLRARGTTPHLNNILGPSPRRVGA